MSCPPRRNGACRWRNRRTRRDASPRFFDRNERESADGSADDSRGDGHGCPFRILRRVVLPDKTRETVSQGHARKEPDWLRAIEAEVAPSPSSATEQSRGGVFR